MRLFLDLETYNRSVSISAGTHKYAETAEILLCAYALGDGDAVVHEYPAAADIQRLVDAADEVVIHNSAFDRTVLRHAGVHLPAEKVTDTMVLALMHALPGGLDQLCDILKVAKDKAKDKEGKKLIRLFCQPQSGKGSSLFGPLDRATAGTHPDEWARFVNYARLDVEAMREIYKKLPRRNVTDTERQVWLLDQSINDRGVAIDTGLVRAAQRAVDEAQDRLAKAVQRLTDGRVTAATQRDALLSYIFDTYDVRLDDLTGATVDQLLADPETPGELRQLLRLRAAAATTSTAKYTALARSTSSDGRLRGGLQYCGASRTGRWAGRLFQPQNLPRAALDAEQVEIAIEAMRAGAETLLLDDVMAAASSALRGCIVAAPGHRLIVADLSNIEGRVLAWLADEDWKIEAFREFDLGRGPDLYKLAYARAFAKDPGDVSKDERQIGKVMELACGYQGGHNAFNTMGAIYGLTFEEAKAKELVQAWRKAHRRTVALWYGLEEAVILAVAAPGKEIPLPGGKLSVVRHKAWLQINLPGGRALCYPSPRVVDGKISYMGIDQYTRKWDRLETYGGKLVENVTQAVARDVLAEGMLAAEADGYRIVLTVHDEIISEVPMGDRYSVDGLADHMATPPEWAAGLPLAAAGFSALRYRKD
jgi:DNA polymerase